MARPHWLAVWPARSGFVRTVISPSRASLDPSRVVLQQPRANLSILDWEYTYGLLIPRWVGPGNTNLTAAACVQQAVYRFCRGLCTSFQRRTRPCATIGLFRHGLRDVAKRSPPLSLCTNNNNPRVECERSPLTAMATKAKAKSAIPKPPIIGTLAAVGAPQAISPQLSPQLASAGVV